MTDSKPTQCHFVSDLHLLASRSYGDDLLEPIRTAAANSSDFVLGGDIFDFRWSTLKSSRHSMDFATDWLQSLVGDFPACHFHYVLGNHDHHGEFPDRLEDLSRQASNFEWQPLCLRIQDSVFLHGDAADGHSDSASLARTRERDLHRKRKQPYLHRIYDATVKTGIHKTIPRLMHPHGRVLRRLMNWLQATGHGRDNGVNAVYFGHTHHPMEVQYRGVWFHNGGAAIRGQTCRILRVQHRDGNST